MKDEQFEILVNLINETKEELSARIDNVNKDLNYKINKEIKSLRTEFREALIESETHVIKMINELRKDVEKYMGINEREHQTLMNIIETRYADLEEEMLFAKDDIKTLHTLSKMNDAKHLEYDKILSSNSLA